MTYVPVKRTAKTKVISLVGKGITYDTGGYSLKPGDSMIGMKGDMAGAASVLGVMKAVARLKPNVEVRGYIPTTENMINGEATRVGDIVKAMNGKTIEILNTDAEGRLILADALTLACKDKAHIVIDIATLTGACMVALGMQYAGVFCDDQKLTDDIIEQGAIAGERFWPLPLAPEYAASIKSSVADLKNIAGNRWAGATIGGLFLKEFVTPETRWAHLDIAGPSDADSSRGHIKQGGVGFAVRTLTRMILNQR
jgi:leucyl aminopeptidase